MYQNQSKKIKRKKYQKKSSYEKKKTILEVVEVYLNAGKWSTGFYFFPEI